MNRDRLRLFDLIVLLGIVFITMLLCVCIGSVNIPIQDTLQVFYKGFMNQGIPDYLPSSIIFSVRFPRVLCVGLVGASLALCGGAMQGLLRNPLADGSTMGVSSGASLGAVIAIAFQIELPFLPIAGTMGMAILCAFLSLMLILFLSYKFDYSLTTNTIILMGVIFSMFANSVISFIITFAGEKVKSITFWTLGSLAQSSYQNAGILFIALALFGSILLFYAQELNAFAIGEEHAWHIGVNVKQVKLTVLITVSCLIGICISAGGNIGFVGLVIPHMVRMVFGPNHKRLLPACIFFGAIFLMLADLISRIILRPLELPIGVVTSFIGSVVFVYIFYRARKSA